MGRNPVILACLCVYNEMDILPYLLKHLNSQGISIFIFDNYSTDGTWKFLRHNHFACERLDTHNQLNLELIIQTKIKKWHSVRPKWCIYQDADEFSFTSEFRTLSEFITDRDRKGFNVISQKRYQFMPTGKEDFSKGDPRKIFEYYGKHPLRMERIFKYYPGLNFGRSGGHSIKRENKRVSLEGSQNPILEYSLRKNPEITVRERLKRCPRIELIRGWHGHYTRMAKQRRLVWKREKLFRISDPGNLLYRFCLDKRK